MSTYDADGSASTSIHIDVSSLKSKLESKGDEGGIELSDAVLSGAKDDKRDDSRLSRKSITASAPLMRLRRFDFTKT